MGKLQYNTLYDFLLDWRSIFSDNFEKFLLADIDPNVDISMFVNFNSIQTGCQPHPLQ